MTKKAAKKAAKAPVVLPESLAELKKAFQAYEDQTDFKNVAKNAINQQSQLLQKIKLLRYSLGSMSKLFAATGDFHAVLTFHILVSLNLSGSAKILSSVTHF